MVNNSVEEWSMFDHIIHFLHRYFCIIVRYFMVKIYDEHGQKMPPVDNPLLLDSATSIAEKIRTKQVSATQVMKAFIKRTKQINPLLNCVIDERYNNALEESAEVDKLIASNKYSVDELRESKPFLGVPISTKDSIGVKGMIQTSGIWPRRGLRSSQDADTIQLMRKAGAIPYVITNVPELCMWWESANILYGRTRNPYDTNRIVGGSSGGEAALLASGGSPFGIGSDLAGSIRMPAFFCGIFGHKPTALVVSNHGQWPEITSKQESYATLIGPMARFACDLQPMLKIVAGEKANDLDLDKPVNVASLNYFYQENDGGAFCVSEVDDDVRNGMKKVINYLQNELKTKPQRVEFGKFKESISIWAANLKSDGATHGLEHELANNNGQIHTYTELLKWCIGQSKHTLPGLLNCVEEKFGIQCGSTEHLTQVKVCEDLRQKFNEMLGETGVFIYPTHPTIAPYHKEPIIKPFNLSYTAIFNVLGFPSTNIPLGLGKEGLPTGIQVVANHHKDRLCLAVACELERAFGGWVQPDFID